MGVVTEAIENQENVPIPEDKLIIPSNVKVKVLDPRALSNGFVKGSIYETFNK